MGRGYWNTEEVVSMGANLSCLWIGATFINILSPKLKGLLYRQCSLDYIVVEGVILGDRGYKVGHFATGNRLYPKSNLWHGVLCSR